MKPYRIVLADDHVLFRSGIRSILEKSGELSVVGETGDGLELLEFLKRKAADLVILDISMPNLRGLEALREIKKVYPETRVLILTMHRDKEYVYSAVSAGAEGYLLKEDADTELFAAVKRIQMGGHYVSPLLSGSLTHDLVMERRTQQETPPREALTLREREVLKLIAEGRTSSEIGDLLYISTRTVEHHRASIMKKLGVRHTANLVKYAIRKGYTTP